MPIGENASVTQKIRFFDDFVKATMKVDPAQIRAQVRPVALGYSEPPTVSEPVGTVDQGYVDTLETGSESADSPPPGYEQPLSADDTDPTTNPPPGYEQPLSTADSQDDPGLLGYAEGLSADGVPAQPQPGLKSGLVGTPLGEKYRGEEKGEGWRKGRKHNGQQVKTDYYDETRKNQSKVAFNPDGTAADRNGALDGKRGFVVDPETGAVHQFSEFDRQTVGNEILVTHHSSPLSGGDVAGAGMIEFDDGQITKISDQSGHYKPSGEITFQAVEQINSANPSGRSPLLDTRVDDSGRSSDALTPEMKMLITTLENLETAIKDKQQELADGGGADGQKTAEIVKLQADAQGIREVLIEKGVDIVPNKEAAVSLLGKTGMLSDDEYRPLSEEYKKVNRDQNASFDEKAAALAKLKDGYNRVSALKQLLEPLGEVAFATLLKAPRTANGSAIETAMRAHGIEPGSKDAVKRLKAALGAKAVAAIKDDEDQIKTLSAKYGVVAINKDFEHGADIAAFEVGQETAMTLTTQQFLQTGGNEAQIRNKRRLMDELLTANLKPDLPAVEHREDNAPDSEAEPPADTAARDLRNGIARLEESIDDVKERLSYVDKLDSDQLDDAPEVMELMRKKEALEAALQQLLSA